ncbi:transglutaminase family protein [uncultured Sneathiella sp.]|uniref:transglutaminase-like domain-containing protein n=1 Tax=uncultured Sneathiella sp. TaxID=879315 RepID=UPI0030EDCBDF|tara:strand:- start:3240 stop:3977 length:738 start_codon:yes stop_codon:yes gene_type:complete
MQSHTHTENLPEEVAEFLSPGEFVDSDSPEIQAYVAEALKDLSEDISDTEKAIRLFEMVRDGLRYDPYNLPLTADLYRASAIAKSDSGFCVPKAILLAACLRAAGIPAALGFADVRNHLNTPKLAELMGTDIFIYHGYVQVWLDGKTYKITPAFNSDMCDRFGVKPLVFDGKSDALFHEFNQQEQRHMEYVNDRGLFKDIPIGVFLKEFYTTYPGLVAFNQERAEKKASEEIDDEFTARNEGAKA